MEIPSFQVPGNWLQILEQPCKAVFEEFWAAHLSNVRWFACKSRTVKATEIVDAVPIGDNANAAVLLLVVEYTDAEPQLYQITLAFAADAGCTQMDAERTPLVRLRVGSADGVIYGGLSQPGFCTDLLRVVVQHRHVCGRSGALFGLPTMSLRSHSGTENDLSPRVLQGEQSNSTIVYGQQFVLKLFRRLSGGLNPDVEMGQRLTEQGQFKHIAAYIGHIEYRGAAGENITLGVLQSYVQNAGDAWQFTLGQLSQYLERTAAARQAGVKITAATAPLVDLAKSVTPRVSHELIGPYLEAAQLLGERTAEMHVALASITDSPQFCPEPFTREYQQALRQSLCNSTESAFEGLRRRLASLGPEQRLVAESVLAREERLLGVFRLLEDHVITAERTRIHGDFHLGQVLWTGRDFAVVDFEGEPAVSIAARRMKRSPLCDVCGMIRSLHYASYQAAALAKETRGHSPEQLEWLDAEAVHWYQWSAAAYLRAYLRKARGASFLPKGESELRGLIQVFLLEKAVYELKYELDSRPAWIILPLRGIDGILQSNALA